MLTLPFLEREGLSIQKLRRNSRGLYNVLLRLTIGLSLILSLAGAQVVRTMDDITVVFALDLSDSVPPEEQARAEAFIRDAMASMPANAQAAIVAFGDNALIEQLPTEAHTLATIASIPGPGRTNIADALRLALAIFPAGNQKRLVLLSDGLENVGTAQGQADLLAKHGVEIVAVPLLAPSATQEAFITDVKMPTSAREGQAFGVTVVIESNVAQQATLRLLGDGTLLASQHITLEPGTNRIQLTATAETPGFHRYQIELTPEMDTLLQNNVGSGFTVVYGPPRVLLATQKPKDAEALNRALLSTGVETTLVSPESLPSDLITLNNYDTVVLVNVPARALAEKTSDILPVYVRELGRGLVMIGGEQSYGAGGYLRSPLEAALPVDMDVRSRTKEPNLALVLAIDKSGSMGRCHCDNPNARPGEYEPIESGLPKVDIAKDAIMMASEALGRLDYLGIVAFDENAHWAYELQHLVNPVTLQHAIGGLQAEGMTNIFAGLEQAEQALTETSARVKHIILVTDGWSNSGTYSDLTTRLAKEGITLSVIAAGQGSPDYLKRLAEAGAGRYHPVPSIHDMPNLFFRETVEATGHYLIEEAFYPLPSSTTPILRGVDPMAVPALLGYNGTTPKSAAQVALISPRGDPVLAQWQYGLGRTVAWTSDLSTQWASEWVTWDRFNTFVTQMVNWTLPDPSEETLNPTVNLDGATAHIVVEAQDDAGQPRDLLETQATLLGPNMVSTTVVLEQTAAGRYEGNTSLSTPGSYLMHIVQRDSLGHPVAQRTSGLVIPYSPEYQRTGQGDVLMKALVDTTAGSISETPADVFAPTQTPASQATPLWSTLLLIATLLFPLDIAARRLHLTSSDWARLREWVKKHARKQKVKVSPTPVVLSELFEARARAQHQRNTRPVIGEHKSTGAAVKPDLAAPAEEQERALSTSSIEVTSSAQIKPSESIPAPDASTSKENTEDKAMGDPAENSLARLRTARDRARRR